MKHLNIINAKICLIENKYYRYRDIPYLFKNLESSTIEILDERLRMIGVKYENENYPKELELRIVMDREHFALEVSDVIKFLIYYRLTEFAKELKEFYENLNIEKTND